jgi:hypothetical protein
VANEHNEDFEAVHLESDRQDIARRCDSCGADLTGRRPGARFCGAQCRSATRRKRRDDQLTNIITALEEAIAALKAFGVQS